MDGEEDSVSKLSVAGLMLVLFSFVIYGWAIYFGVPNPEVGRSFPILGHGDTNYYVWPALAYAIHGVAFVGFAAMFFDFLLMRLSWVPRRWLIPFDEFTALMSSRTQIALSWVYRIVFGVAAGTSAFIGFAQIFPKDNFWFSPITAALSGFGLFYAAGKAGPLWGILGFLAALCVLASFGGLHLLLHDKIALLLSPLLFILGFYLAVCRYRRLLRRL